MLSNFITLRAISWETALTIIKSGQRPGTVDAGIFHPPRLIICYY